MIDICGGVLTTTSTAFEFDFHMNYESTILPIRDGKPKYKGLPSAYGGADELLDENIMLTGASLSPLLVSSAPHLLLLHHHNSTSSSHDPLSLNHFTSLPSKTPQILPSSSPSPLTGVPPPELTDGTIVRGACFCGAVKLTAKGTSCLIAL